MRFFFSRLLKRMEICIEFVECFFHTHPERSRISSAFFFPFRKKSGVNLMCRNTREQGKKIVASLESILQLCVYFALRSPHTLTSSHTAQTGTGLSKQRVPDRVNRSNAKNVSGIQLSIPVDI